MRFSLYLTLRLNILCAAPVFYHSIYLKSIWSILCTLRHVPMTVNLNVYWNIFWNVCMANECMLNANWPCSTCILIQLTFRTTTVNVFVCNGFQSNLSFSLVVWIVQVCIETFYDLGFVIQKFWIRIYPISQ